MGSTTGILRVPLRMTSSKSMGGGGGGTNTGILRVPLRMTSSKSMGGDKFEKYGRWRTNYDGRSPAGAIFSASPRVALRLQKKLWQIANRMGVLFRFRAELVEHLLRGSGRAEHYGSFELD